jgi:hypothetical protein
MILVGLLALSAVAAEGCRKHNELPAAWHGRYRRTALFGLVADQYVVVGNNQLTVENCQFNCGENVVQLATVNCTGAGATEVCNYTSTHCTGTISMTSGNRINITAVATATGATGPALATHNETCNNIRGNLMTRQ